MTQLIILTNFNEEIRNISSELVEEAMLRKV